MASKYVRGNKVIGQIVFVLGALLVGLGLTIEKSGALLIIGLVMTAAGYVILRGK